MHRSPRPCSDVLTICSPTPSNTREGARPLKSPSERRKRGTRPCCSSVTMGRASTWPTSTSSSACFSGYTATRSSRAPESVWRTCAVSSSDTVGVSGLKGESGRGATFFVALPKNGVPKLPLQEVWPDRPRCWREPASPTGSKSNSPRHHRRQKRTTPHRPTSCRGGPPPEGPRAQGVETMIGHPRLGSCGGFHGCVSSLCTAWNG